MAAIATFNFVQFGRSLEAERLRRGLTKAAVAKECGLTSTVISNALRGQSVSTNSVTALLVWARLQWGQFLVPPPAETGEVPEDIQVKRDLVLGAAEDVLVESAGEDPAPEVLLMGDNTGKLLGVALVGGIIFALARRKQTPAPVPPVPSFTSAPLDQFAPQTLQFTNTTTGEVTGYAWDFGDGGTSAEVSPAHEFLAPGAYTVTLTATGPGGTASFQSIITTVVAEPPDPPASNFTASAFSGQAPLIVSFTNLSTGDGLSYLWDFGDGVISTEVDPTHTFVSGGTFTVVLTATGPGGPPSLSQMDIVVTLPPPPPPVGQDVPWDAMSRVVALASGAEIAAASADLMTVLNSASGRTWSQGPDVAGPAIRLSIDPSAPNAETFRLTGDSDGISIVGASPIAVAHGIYHLCEEIGARWFFKSALWHVLPSSLPALSGLDELHMPHYKYRRIWAPNTSGAGEQLETGAWARRNRTLSAENWLVRHSYNNVISPSDATVDPAVFCPSPTDRRQLNPLDMTVIQRAISYAQSYLSADPSRVSVPVSPNDGRGWCWPEADTQLTTDNVTSLALAVRDALRTSHPGKFVTLYNYSTYSDVPSQPDLSGLHYEVATAFDETLLNDQQRVQGLFAKGASVGIREYISPWAWFEDLHDGETLREVGELQNYTAWGVTTYNGEGVDSWGVYGLLYYLMSKLFWNPTLDVNALIQDFYAKCFGPAAADVEAYYSRWLRGDPVNDRALDLSFGDLDAALAAVAPGSAEARRIQWLQLHCYYMWKWRLYRAGALDLAQTQSLYTFVTRLRDAYIVFHRYPENRVRGSLIGLGITSAQVDALRSNVLHSDAEVAALVAEAKAALVGAPLDVAVVPYSVPDLRVLNAAGFAPLGGDRIGGQNIYVQALAGETVLVNFWTQSPSSAGSWNWRAPDGSLLQTVSLPGTRSPGTEVPLLAPVDGIYTITGSGGINVKSHAYSLGPRGGIIGTQSFYFFVPIGALGVVVQTTRAGRVVLTGPAGMAADVTLTGAGEVPVPEPASGVWKIAFTSDSTNQSSFALLGVPDLLGKDASRMLIA